MRKLTGLVIIFIAFYVSPMFFAVSNGFCSPVSDVVKNLEKQVPWKNKKRAAVFPFVDLATGKATVEGKSLAGEFSSAFTVSRKFSVITRKTENLTEILGDELSDLKDEKTRVRIGRLYGIQVVLKGSYRDGWLGRTIHAELTDLERGTVWAVTAEEFSPSGWVWGGGLLLIVGAGIGAAGEVRRRNRARMELDKRRSEGLYAEAMGFYADGNYAEALSKAREALELNSGHFEASVLIEKIENAPAPAAPAVMPPGDNSPSEEKPEGVEEPPRETSKPAPQMPPAFQIRVWTDNFDNPLKQERLGTRDIKVLPSREESRYRLGDRILIHFASEKDCYLRLVNIGPTGNIVQLFPNKWHPDNRLRSGDIHTLPGPEYGGFEMRLGPPGGLETVKAYASTEPFELANLEEGGEFSKIMARDIRVLPGADGSPVIEDYCKFFVGD
jgi:TolB-like protein